MKIQVVAILIVGGLVGCSADKAGDAPRAAPSATEAATSSVVAEPVSLPEGVNLPSGYVLRNVMERRTQKGEQRNRSVFEYADGDSKSAYEAAKASLEAAGFTAGELKVDADGVLANTFRKAGYGRVQVSTSDNIGRKPKNPAAKGVLSLDWPKGTGADSVVE